MRSPRNNYSLDECLNRIKPRGTKKNPSETIGIFSKRKNEKIDSRLTNGENKTKFDEKENSSDLVKIKADITKEIYDSSETLRKELEAKIEKKVPNCLFYGACAVVAIITGFLVYQYIIPTDKAIEEVMKDHNSIEHRLDKIESSLDTKENLKILQDNISEISRNQKVLHDKVNLIEYEQKKNSVQNEK